MLNGLRAHVAIDMHPSRGLAHGFASGGQQSMPAIVDSTAASVFKATAVLPTAGNSATENTIRKANIALAIRIHPAVILLHQRSSNKKTRVNYRSFMLSLLGTARKVPVSLKIGV